MWFICINKLINTKVKIKNEIRRYIYTVWFEARLDNGGMWSR